MAKGGDSPRRKLSRERGAIVKDWGGRIPIALVYPNTYYLAMSNLGFQTLYRLFNAYDDFVCERVVWDAKAGQYSSIESQRPLTDFAVIAFSISYELDYFNVVDVLRRSSIPLYAADRDHSHPLVMAGGPPVSANPKPLAAFFDCVAIGEAEAILPAMVDTVRENVGADRTCLLHALSSIPGLFVPLLHDGRTIHRQWVRDINAFATNSVVLTPDTELGGMYLIEITRGCRWGCRFCLVGYTFRPFRYRSTDHILDQARVGLEQERRVGLVGASPSDHPQIEELVASLQRMGARVSISSLRIRPLPPVLVSELTRAGVQSIALAPEAGPDRLRRTINKGVADSDIIEATDKIREQGFKHLKLYFMIGLPTETDDDIRDIMRLTLSLKRAFDRSPAGTRITAAVEPFVPKANTPFQWLPMADAGVLTHRLSLLKRSLRPKGIDVASESVKWAVIQGVLSRGDERLAPVLASMEDRSLSSWQQAMAAHSLTSEHYVNRQMSLDEKLPWADIDSGVSAEYLAGELAQAFCGMETPPCPLTECHKCGVC